jgi:NAD(P)-dependent dehydrogenase (short-subunit alcohol dehydrogenase family)
MSETLRGKTAIVTGAAGGYGRGMAEALAGRGAKVFASDIDQGGLDGLQGRDNITPVRADVMKPADLDALFETVSGGLDILVNNAGGAVKVAPIDEQDDEAIEMSIRLNLTSKAWCCRRAAALMKPAGSGTIINIASVCARQAWPGWGPYSAAKAGVVALSNCMSTELRDSGVTVTTVMPSWGATNFTIAAGLGPRDADEAAQCIKPEELGRIVADICSLPPHLTVQDITVWPKVQVVEPL